MKKLKFFAKYFFLGWLCTLPVPVIVLFTVPLDAGDYSTFLGYLLLIAMLFPGGLIFCLFCKAYTGFKKGGSYGNDTVNIGIVGLLFIFIRLAALPAFYCLCLAGPVLLLEYLEENQIITASWYTDGWGFAAVLLIPALYILLLIGLLINWLIKNSKYKKLRDSIISKLSASEKIQFNDIIKETESAISPIPISINTDKGSFTFLE